VVIYASLPFTGATKEIAETISNAAKMAVEDFTGGTGKIGNLTVEFIALDDATAAKGGWDADAEKAIAIRAANDPDAVAYIGPAFSGAAKVSIPILSPAGIVMVTPSATYPGLTKALEGLTEKNEPEIYYPGGVRNFFRVVPTDELQAPATVEAFKKLNAKKIFVIDDSAAAGKGLAEVVAISCKSAGLDCTQRTSITGKESDYKTLAATIKTQNPDAVYFSGSVQSQPGKLIGDIRAAGIKIPFIGADGIVSSDFIKDAGAAGEGTYATFGGIPDEMRPAKGQDFIKRYKAKYGPPQSYTLYGYECMGAILTAIKNAGSKDRKAVLTAMSNLKDYDGILGKWSFDKNGDTSLTEFTVFRVEGNEWKFFTLVKPNS
jgi:branched-chain amino acid transport system substrate-binding protein